MTITVLPTAPNRATNTPQQFSDNMDAILSALVTAVPQMNSDIAGLNTMGLTVPLSYTFSSTTADADPGNGVIRLNSGTQNLSTVIRMDLSDVSLTSQQTLIDTFDDSTSGVKGFLRIAHRDFPTAKYLVFAVTSMASPAGYRNITGTCVSSSASNPFANTDPLVVSFARSGDAGAVTELHVQNQTFSAFTTGGTGTAYTLTPVPAISGYAANQSFYVNFNVASGINPTLNISGLGATLNLVRMNPDGTFTNILAAEIPAGHRSQVVLVSTTLAWVVTLPSAVTMQFSAVSFRNCVRNGRMDAAQRGVNFFSLGTGNQYITDGWRYSATSTTAVVNCFQVADAPADNEFQYSLRVTVATADAAVAAGDVALLYQPIEGYLVRDKIGKPIALSFRVKSPKTGTHFIALQNSGGDRSYVMPYTVVAANTWETKNIVIPDGLITAGTWNWTNGVGLALCFPLMAGTTYQAAATGSWQTGSFYAAAGQQNLLDTLGASFAVTGVQLEKGAYPGPFEHRDIATETQLNQRYYEVINYSQMYFSGHTGTAIQVPIEYRTLKRAAPTVTLPTSVNAAFGAGGGALTPTTWTVAGATTDTLSINASAGVAVAGIQAGTLTVSAEL